MTPEVATELVVIRHGETTWNSSRRMQGHLDTDLTPLGRAQAAAAGTAIAAERFDAIYSSDLGRAMQTAEIIGRRLGLAVCDEPRLRERCLGIAQGCTFAEFEQRWPDQYALFRSGDPDYVIPDGESLRQVHDRAIRCADEVAARHAGGRVILVTHGGILSVYFRHAVGLAMTAARRFDLPNAGIQRFRVSGGEWRLASWGEISHLRDLPAADDL